MNDCYVKSIEFQDEKCEDSIKPKKTYLFHKHISFLQLVIL